MSVIRARWEMEALINKTLKSQRPGQLRTKDLDKEVVDVIYGLLEFKDDEFSYCNLIGRSFLEVLSHTKDYEKILDMKPIRQISALLVCFDDPRYFSDENFSQLQKLVKPHTFAQALNIARSNCPQNEYTHVLAVVNHPAFRSITFLPESINQEVAHIARRQPTFLHAISHMQLGVGWKRNGSPDKVDNFLHTLQLYSNYLAGYRKNSLKYKTNRAQERAGDKKRMREEKPYDRLRTLTDETKTIMQETRSLIKDDKNAKEHMKSIDNWVACAEDLIMTIDEFFDEDMETNLRTVYEDVRKILKMAPPPERGLDMVHMAGKEFYRIGKELSRSDGCKIWKSFVAPEWEKTASTIKIKPRTREECLEMAASGEISLDAILYRVLLGSNLLLMGDSSSQWETRAGFQIKLLTDVNKLLQSGSSGTAVESSSEYSDA